MQWLKCSDNTNVNSYKWIKSHNADTNILQLTTAVYSTPYRFLWTWVSVWAWAWWGMSGTSVWWSVWIIRLWSIVVIISIVHWRSTSWLWRLHRTTTSSYTGNTCWQLQINNVLIKEENKVTKSVFYVRHPRALVARHYSKSNWFYLTEWCVEYEYEMSKYSVLLKNVLIYIIIKALSCLMIWILTVIITVKGIGCLHVFLMN